jgi:hypothetical protein
MARDRARLVMGRNYVSHQYPNRIQMAFTKLDPSISDEAVTVDYLMEHVWIVGDASECVGRRRPSGARRPSGVMRPGRR